MKLATGDEVKGLKGRIVGLGAFFVVGLLVLAVNLYRLMVVRFDEFSLLSQDNMFKDVRVRAGRGLIRDVRGEVLVDARPSLDLFITPAFCQRCVAEVIPRLSVALGWTDEQRDKAVQLVREAHGPQRYQPLVIQVDLSRDQFDLLLAHQHLLPGVELEAVPHREYRTGPALAHVIGYMNEITQEELARLNDGADRPPYAMGDYIGRRGVERTFEAQLRGNDGWTQVVVNARGEVMRDEAGRALQQRQSAPVPGNNLVLSIDARLQAEAERVFPGVAGAVVVMESSTGFVRAMVSRPSYDPNEMTGRVSPQRLAQLNKDPLKPMVFRAAAEHYHPGSTFKVVPLLAALKAGTFTETTQVSCGGGYTLGSRRWRCHKESGHGPVHLRHAMQWSCDTFFYRVADVMGIDPIAEMGRALGFGQPTGFQVAAEVPGVMPDSQYHDRSTPGGYTKGMALNTAIGQGDVNVTPLQLAVAYSAIANGGAVYRPQVVRRVETPSGEVVKAFEPELNGTVAMDPAHRALVMDALSAVVNEPGGTAFRSRLAELKVAGKTGTAQVARLGAVRLKTHQMSYWERDHAWFVAVAPVEAPELTVVVLNEHGGHGGTDAAPAASAIIRKYFELKALDSQAFAAVAAAGATPRVPPSPVTWPELPPLVAAPGPLVPDGGTSPLVEAQVEPPPEGYRAAPPVDPGAPVIPQEE